VKNVRLRESIDAHRGGRGGRGGEGGGGAPLDPPIKIFEKLPHKNAIKHDPPDFLTTPKYPPQKNLPKKPEDPPPWISNYRAPMDSFLIHDHKSVGICIMDHESRL
jgi:hypothetical protein